MMMGHKVIIFKSQFVPGGLLTQGIPPYRLPKDGVNKEIERIKRMGLVIQTDKRIDRVYELPGFDAILITIGIHEPLSLNIPGEELNGVIKYIGGYFI